MSTPKKSKIYFFGTQILSLGAATFAIVGSGLNGRQAFTSETAAENAFSKFKNQASMFVLETKDSGTVATLLKPSTNPNGVVESIELNNEQIKSLKDSVKTKWV